MPQIVAWALVGACRLLKHGNFSVSAKHGSLMDEWRRSTDSVAAFVHDRAYCCIKEVNGQELKTWPEGSKVQSHCSAFCKNNNYRPVGRNKLFERLRGINGLDVRENWNGVMVVVGLELINEWLVRKGGFY
jgi:phage/plasmid-associated DNA primase